MIEGLCAPTDLPSSRQVDRESRHDDMAGPSQRLATLVSDHCPQVRRVQLRRANTKHI